jgi:hypothetical protein
LGTKTVIVLSSDTAVKDLLDKKGGIYSDRPDMFIGQKIASGNHRLVVMVSIPIDPDHRALTASVGSVSTNHGSRNTAPTGE